MIHFSRVTRCLSGLKHNPWSNVKFQSVILSIYRKPSRWYLYGQCSHLTVPNEYHADILRYCMIETLLSPLFVLMRRWTGDGDKRMTDHNDNWHIKAYRTFWICWNYSTECTDNRLNIRNRFYWGVFWLGKWIKLTLMTVKIVWHLRLLMYLIVQYYLTFFCLFLLLKKNLPGS